MTAHQRNLARTSEASVSVPFSTAASSQKPPYQANTSPTTTHNLDPLDNVADLLGILHHFFISVKTRHGILKHADSDGV